ncbi:MAG: arylsulfatase [Verrucomicrobiales bacterium]|nr:arylsulfatase [Verrucomicrobiales bacterium]
MNFRLFSCVLAFGVSLAAAADRPEKPNIIFILADDLGYGDLSCYGSKLIQTPVIDQMATEGMRFTQFYAGSTVCAPSRCVLMTGKHTGHARVRGNAGRENPAAQMLKSEDITVAEVLKGAGYQTALVGKWGLGMPGDEGIPNRQGFDYFYGYLSQHHAHNHYPDFLWKNTSQDQLPNEVKAIGEFGGGYATKRVVYAGDRLTEEALDFVNRSKDAPFFLYLAYVVPHANNERTRELGDGQEVPEYGIYESKDWPNPDKGQAAMVTRMDSQIGELFAQLKSLGLDDKTVVFFSSDNGPHKEGGNDPEFFDANGPYTGIKRSLTDGGIRVPFIARWPGVIPAGEVSTQVGYFGDIMATLADLAGTPPPAGLDSLSLLPTLTGHPDQQEQRDYLYWEFFEKNPLQAVLMDGRWKAIRDVRSDTVALYDQTQDVAEEHDVAAEHPDLVTQARQKMKEANVPDPLWDINKPAANRAKKK